MTDLAQRQRGNPLLTPNQVRPSRPDLVVECLLNPGVFRFENEIWLLVRVAERPVQNTGRISFPVIRDGELEIISFEHDDPSSTPRIQGNRGTTETYLSTLSHLRLLASHDGVRFEDADRPNLTGLGSLEDLESKIAGSRRWRTDPTC